MFAAILFVLIALSAPALGALPVAPGPYIIKNPQTQFVVADHFYGTAIGNTIIANKLHAPVPPMNITNQQWNIERIGTLGTSGIYTFVCVGPVVYPAVPSFVGAGLSVQSGPTPFSVTEVPAGSGNYTICYPFAPLCVTTQPLPSLAVGTLLRQAPCKVHMRFDP